MAGKVSRVQQSWFFGTCVYRSTRICHFPTLVWSSSRAIRSKSTDLKKYCLQARKKLQSENILFNCSGRLFEIDSESLDRHPSTILGSKLKRRKFYDRRYEEYFIDRHRPTFEVVLDYYVYGVLRRPSDIPLDVFINELAFYQLEKFAVEDFLAEEGILLQEEVKLVVKKTEFKIG